MENLIVTIRNQYSTEKLIGTRKEVISKLQRIAIDKRNGSRQARHLPNNVQSLPSESHQSELVTMASFQVKRCGLERLLELLNNHGVESYEVEIDLSKYKVFEYVFPNSSKYHFCIAKTKKDVQKMWGAKRVHLREDIRIDESCGFMEVTKDGQTTETLESYIN